MLDLVAAQKILSAALDYATAHGFKPLGIAVSDARGALKVFASQDGTSLKRAEIAIAKGHGALALGMGSRALAKRAETHPAFISGAISAVGGMLVPVAGGVLIKTDGEVIGVVGVSGDTSDNDEAAAIAGIEAAGFSADPG